MVGTRGFGRGRSSASTIAYRRAIERAFGLAAREQQVEQVVVGQCNQRFERLRLPRRQRVPVTREESLEKRSFSSRPRRQRHFRRPSAFGSSTSGMRHQTARRTISSLILPIALVGFRPFGQTSTQFMIVWQRNSRYGSSRLSSRSPVAWSRLSAMKRYACSRPAGPTNLSGFHQKLGHDVEQLAHRMHSYRPFSSSRSSGDCSRSFSGGGRR